jgi:AraC-like DNA-binding protein
MLSVSYSISINPQPHSTSLGVLFAGHSQTESYHEVGPQVLDHYLVHYIVSGKGVFHCKGKDYILGQGDSFVIFPGELVSYVSDSIDPWRYRWIAFKGDHSQEILNELGISPDQPCAKTNNFRRINVLFYQTQQILKSGSSNCGLRSNGYLRLVLAEYNEALTQSKPREKITEAQQQIERAIRWLTLQYSRPLSIEEMAQNLGYHRTHLSKIFKQQTGMSPMNYLLKIRMERAAYLLKTEPLTIQQIASSVGYSDALYFSKQFKKWHGVSPSVYDIK